MGPLFEGEVPSPSKDASTIAVFADRRFLWWTTEGSPGEHQCLLRHGEVLPTPCRRRQLRHESVQRFRRTAKARRKRGRHQSGLHLNGLRALDSRPETLSLVYGAIPAPYTRRSEGT